MANSFLVKSIVASISFSSLVASSAMAATYKMNAMCYLQDKQSAQVKEFNPTQQEIRDTEKDSEVRNVPTNVTAADVNTKFRVASLSKILVTHWAVATLGPEYRFKTKINVTPADAASKSCYVHISGDQDIFMGKEMLTTVFNQLKPILAKQNCTTISQLSYDEKFVIPFYTTNNFIFDHRKISGFRGRDPEMFYGPLTTQKALTYFIRNFGPISVKTIKPARAAEYKKYAQTVPVKTYSFKSRPLYMMMREYNAYSSNIPPNILFEKLGGATAYSAFIKNRLGFDSSNLTVLNGSGYPVLLNKGQANEQKVYNEVTCGSIVRVIQDLDHMLKAYKGSKNFQLADVMAVGGPDEDFSTFKSLYSDSKYDNTLTAKTGSAEKAITFGGMLSTADGPLYFAALTEPEAYENLGSPRKYIRDLVSILADRQKLKKFDYTQIGPMNPTDAAATLVEESTNLSTKLN
ncbi:hypothetical protein [Bdellovibrio sp. BCCA]|uniref:hypothetical protein n=1 Tax=Bdellovibrio sp. BCCA TaxID=3136281 RepID=UPI0030EFAE83